MKILNKKVITTIIFILFCFALSLTLAIIQPNDSCPDEKMKMDICKFVADYGELPHGGDERIRNTYWGISYGFVPILSYIISGVFIKIASCFSNDLHVFYISARLTSVICYSIMTFFVIKIGEKIFKNKYYKWLFVILISLLPQVVFLGSYINNDTLALMSISMIIYYWLKGMETKWDIKSCILLGISLGICALSYYNAYGYILTSAILFIIYGLINKIKISEIFKKGLLIVFVTILVCGWWFIRSAIIYNGDFLGLKTLNEYSNKYAMDPFKADNRITPSTKNMLISDMLIKDKWIETTLKSFIGVFGYMSIRAKGYVYFSYGLVLAIGCLGFLLRWISKKEIKSLDRNKILLEIIFIINIIIPICLSIIYSYYSDFQPQGRYIMAVLIPLMYFATCGFELINKIIVRNKILKAIVDVLLIVFFVAVLIICMQLLISTYI